MNVSRRAVPPTSAPSELCGETVVRRSWTTRLLVLGASILMTALALAADSSGARDHELHENAVIAANAKAAPIERFGAAMNLGDLYAERSDPSSARGWWSDARRIAAGESRRLREEGDLAQWARFAAWEATAAAALGDRSASATLFESALRLMPGDVDILSRYATAELSLGAHAHAKELVLSALEHQAHGYDARRDLLDRATLHYTLARADQAIGATGEAESTLERLLTLLFSDDATAVRNEVLRREEFTVHGVSSGDAQAWTSLVTRGATMLAALYAERGRIGEALLRIDQALQVRSDYPAALALRARYERDPSAWIAALESDPFDRALHNGYAESLEMADVSPEPASESTGSRVRSVIELTRAGRWSAATMLVRELQDEYPGNESLLALEADLLKAQGRADEARLVTERITSRATRESIGSAVAASEAFGAPVSGTELDAAELEAIATALRDPASIAATTAAMNGRPYRSRAYLEDAALEGETTKASGARTTDGVTLRFLGTTRFAGDFAETEVVLEYSILAADPRGLVVQPLGVRLP